MTKRKRFDRLAAHGCIVCRNEGLGASAAEIHHLCGHTFSSMGKRASDEDTIPLCPIHHRTGGGGHVGYHQAPAAFERRYGSQASLLTQINTRISHD